MTHPILVALGVGLGSAVVYGLLSALLGWIGDFWRYLDRSREEEVDQSPEARALRFDLEVKRFRAEINARNGHP